MTKSHKIPSVFLCETCNYKCSNKKDHTKHLFTAKHKRLTTTNETVLKVPAPHLCDCGKKYVHASSLYKHKRNCDLKNSSITIQENPEEIPSIMEILSQNKELMSLLIAQNQEHREETSKLQNTILELAPKIGNNTNTTNNNNQFNIQVFLNEDCKDALNFSEFVETIKVSFADLENQAENGYVNGISKLFIESLQSLGVHKRPIHCTDKKRKTLYIKENDAWDKEGSQDILRNGIQEVSRRTYVELGKSKQDNPIEYKDGDSEFSLKCVTIQQNLIPAHPREVTINKVVEKITQNTGILEK